MALPETIAKGRTAVDATVAQAAALLDQKFLDLTIPRQHLDNWCWAAVALGLHDAYRDTGQTQCSIASRVLSLVCSTDGCVTFEPRCNQPWTLPIALASHFLQQLTLQSFPNHRSFPFIRDEIKKGNPVAVRVAFEGQLSGHFVVISGYRRRNNDVDLRVWDPKVGMWTDERLSEFLLNYKQCGGWERSFMTRGDFRVPELP
jgi:hypothetical protein